MNNSVRLEDSPSSTGDHHEDPPVFEHLHQVGAFHDHAVAPAARLHPHLVLCAKPGRSELSPRPQLWATASDVVLHFELSQNEEHARLRLELGSQHIDLGERVHHYSLATLARLRLHDAQRGVAPCSQGWVGTEDLARMLGVDSSYVNIQVYRARQQFAAALAPHITPLPVERRRGEVRLSHCRFTVRRGAQFEGGSLR
jgi:hypothetical protein